MVNAAACAADLVDEIPRFKVLKFLYAERAGVEQRRNLIGEVPQFSLARRTVFVKGRGHDGEIDITPFLLPPAGIAAVEEDRFDRDMVGQLPNECTDYFFGISNCSFIHCKNAWVSFESR